MILFCSLADTYSDGLGNLDFERSQLGSGMSQRSAAKRLVNALHVHAQRTNQKQFDLQLLRSVADRLNIKVKIFRCTEIHMHWITTVDVTVGQIYMHERHKHFHMIFTQNL